MKQPKFKTTGYGTLDVGSGREKLDKFLGKWPNKKRIPVIIYATIEHSVSGDDGVSVEFELDVQEIEVFEAINERVEWKK